MLDWTRAIPPVGTVGIAAAARQVGIDVTPLLARAGLPPLGQITVETRVTGRQEVDLLRGVLAAAPPGLDFGLIEPTQAPMPFIGILRMVMQSAPTYEAALQRNQRYMPLTWGMMDLVLERRGDHLQVTYEPGSLPADVQPYYAQRNHRTSQAWAREHGHDDVLPMQFSFPAPAESTRRDAYVEAYGHLPEFDAPRSGVSIPLEVALTPMTTRSDTLFEGLRDEAERQLEAYLSNDATAPRVRRHLRLFLHEVPTIESVAAASFVAPRTLRRQLAAEGTSFRAELEAVRKERAEEWLRGPNRQIGALATALGYSRAPAFTAAFQRWFGCTPTEYRDRLTAQGDLAAPDTSPGDI